jgi:hypothetical protein
MAASITLRIDGGGCLAQQQHQRSDKRSTGKSSTLEINTNLWRRQPALVTIHFVCVDSFDISVCCFYVGRRGKIDLFELCAFVSGDNVCALV